MNEPELTAADLERLELSDDPIIVFFQARQAEDQAAALAWPDDERQWAYDEIISEHATAERGADTAVVDTWAAQPNAWWTRIHILDGDASLVGHIARHDPATVLLDIKGRLKVFGKQTSDHAPVETIYGIVCRTCVTWLDNEESRQEEFGIAIPVSWPCGVARAFVARWSGHPDYDQAWRPQS